MATMEPQTDNPQQPSPAMTLSKAEAARELGICVRHLERLVQRGVLPPPIRLGRRVRFSRRTLEAWLEQNSRQPPHEMLPPSQGQQG